MDLLLVCNITTRKERDLMRERMATTTPPINTHHLFVLMVLVDAWLPLRLNNAKILLFTAFFVPLPKPQDTPSSDTGAPSPLLSLNNNFLKKRTNCI
mmetsp:Transcript_18647/g.52116  ORF Transcript_18647/g.52116 Transcript_18647/m.52116 type:complete len:97 (+) Transcript_18647:1049-1339(+)